MKVKTSVSYKIFELPWWSRDAFVPKNQSRDDHVPSEQDDLSITSTDRSQSDARDDSIQYHDKIACNRVIG